MKTKALNIYTGSKQFKTVIKFLTAHRWMVLVGVMWFLTFLPVSSFLSTSNKITVTGTSVNSAKNQVSTFNVDVSTQDVSKEKAVEDTNRKAQDVVEGVKSFGIEEEDIQTQNMSVYQREEAVTRGGVQTYEKTDWIASIGVEVTLRDVKKADDLASLLSGMDISHLYGPNFSLDPTSLDETRLLQIALEDAHEKAGYIARKMNRRLGGVISIVEGGSNYSPYPMYRAEMGGAGGMEPGSTDVSKVVTVTYRLR